MSDTISRQMKHCFTLLFAKRSKVKMFQAEIIICIEDFYLEQLLLIKKKKRRKNKQIQFQLLWESLKQEKL